MILSFLSSALLILTNCKDGPAGAGNAPIGFEQQSFYRTLDECRIDSTPCAAVEAAYPLAMEGPEAIREKINDTVFFHLRFSLALFATTIEEIPEDLEAIANEFFSEYRSMQTYQPDYFIPWRVATTGKVLFQSNRTISIQLENYAFAGGAHPNTQTTLLNFDRSTGEIIQMDQVISDRKQLEKIVESAFKEAHQLEGDASVRQSGFFWGESFHLPKNFAILRQGLYFYYNPYEVAAYAAGPTDFIIPYEKLENVVNEALLF